jgi:hypothetical protein
MQKKNQTLENDKDDQPSTQVQFEDQKTAQLIP